MKTQRITIKCGNGGYGDYFFEKAEETKEVGYNEQREEATLDISNDMYQSSMKKKILF